MNTTGKAKRQGAFCTNRILLIRWEALGDIVMLTGVIRSIRKGCPNAEISLLTLEQFADVGSLISSISKVITISLSDLEYKCEMLVNELNKQKFDVLIDFHSSLRDIPRGLLPSRLHIPVRIGYKRYGHEKCFTHTIDQRQYKVRYYEDYTRLLVHLPFSLMGQCPEPILDSSPEVLAFRDIIRIRLRLDKCKSKIVGVYPGARTTHKTWPVRNFVQVVDAMIDRWRVSVVIIGGKIDMQACAEVSTAARNNVPVVVSGSDLVKLAGAIACCDFFVSSDTGPAHMAYAMGVPVITIHGPSDPYVWAPRKAGVVRSNIPCSPCNSFDACPRNSNSCMISIHPQDVLALVSKELGRPRMRSAAAKQKCGYPQMLLDDRYLGRHCWLEARHHFEMSAVGNCSVKNE